MEKRIGAGLLAGCGNCGTEDVLLLNFTAIYRTIFWCCW